ncbi:MAG: ABC transporter permease [Clostridia bacterium]|nr:ABC transporter permease [Clostridia bacterium]
MSNNNSSESRVRDPLVRIAKRNTISKPTAWIIRIVIALAAFILCVTFMWIVGGLSIAESCGAMWKGTFGDPSVPVSVKIKCWDSAIYAAKLLCIAVALAPAFKMKFWNIGAEGQVLIGALATAYVMKNYSAALKGAPLYIVMFAVCIIAGAIWGFLPAFFKSKWGTNETLFTLMMNYVAIKIMDYFYNMWKGKSSSLDAINRETKIGYLPKLFGEQTAINIIIFLIIAVLMFIYLKKTKQGYEISVVGGSQNTARYAGINVNKVIIRTMIISGAICGLCGGLTVAGQTHSIASETTAGGYGFTAIIVAWLAKFNTLAMIPISLLIIFLEKGTAQLGNSYPAFATGAENVLIGIVLFVIIGGEFFLNYRLVFRRSEKEAK